MVPRPEVEEEKVVSSRGKSVPRGVKRKMLFTKEENRNMFMLVKRVFNNLFFANKIKLSSGSVYTAEQMRNKERGSYIDITQ